MSSSSKFFVINNIKLPPDASFEEAFSVAKKRLGSIGIKTDKFEFNIYKKRTKIYN